MSSIITKTKRTKTKTTTTTKIIIRGATRTKNNRPNDNKNKNKDNVSVIAKKRRSFRRALTTRRRRGENTEAVETVLTLYAITTFTVTTIIITGNVTNPDNYRRIANG